MKLMSKKTLERLKIEIETENLKRINKIEGHKIRIESIKDNEKRNKRAKDRKNK